MEYVSLKFEKEEHKEQYLEALVNQAKIPVCKACDKLFQFGFPDTPEGMSDYLICQENYLLCECEYNRIIRNMYSLKEDGLLDITPYYEKK
jgi:hypothetical protein